MFVAILRPLSVVIRPGTFSRYGFIVTLIVLASSCLVLAVEATIVT